MSVIGFVKIAIIIAIVYILVCVVHVVLDSRDQITRLNNRLNKLETKLGEKDGRYINPES